VNVKREVAAGFELIVAAAGRCSRAHHGLRAAMSAGDAAICSSAPRAVNPSVFDFKAGSTKALSADIFYVEILIVSRSLLMIGIWGGGNSLLFSHC